MSRIDSTCLFKIVLIDGLKTIRIRMRSPRNTVVHGHWVTGRSAPKEGDGQSIEPHGSAGETLSIVISRDELERFLTGEDQDPVNLSQEEFRAGWGIWIRAAQACGADDGHVDSHDVRAVEPSYEHWLDRVIWGAFARTSEPP